MWSPCVAATCRWLRLGCSFSSLFHLFLFLEGCPLKSYSDHSIIAEKKVLLNFVTSIYLPAKRKSFWDDDFINIYSVNRRHPGFCERENRLIQVCLWCDIWVNDICQLGRPYTPFHCSVFMEWLYWQIFAIFRSPSSQTSFCPLMSQTSKTLSRWAREDVTPHDKEQRLEL